MGTCEVRSQCGSLNQVVDLESNHCRCRDGTKLDALTGTCIQFSKEVCGERGKFYDVVEEACAEFTVCEEGSDLDRSNNMCVIPIQETATPESCSLLD